MCGILYGSPMRFDRTTKLHRKSGFRLHQLRNRCSEPLSLSHCSLQDEKSYRRERY